MYLKSVNADSDLSIDDSTKHDPTTAQLPSMSPTTNESGDLKYWVISNESMWTGQDNLQKALFEVLSCLAAWFIDALREGSGEHRTDSSECLLWTIKHLRRKLTFLPVIALSSNDIDRRSQSLPPLKEALLFRAFVDSRGQNEVDSLDQF